MAHLKKTKVKPTLQLKKGANAVPNLIIRKCFAGNLKELFFHFLGRKM